MKYQCSRCGEECESDPEWTDEMAKEEYKKNFPDDPEMKLLDPEVVCDNCYKKTGLADEND